MTKPILLKTSEAAVRLGTTERQVQRLVEADVLAPHSTGPRNVMLFKASDLRGVKVSLR